MKFLNYLTIPTILIAAMIGTATAQTSSAARVAKFDVASLRPAGEYTGGMAGGVQVEGKRLLARYVGLNDLIAFAWNVHDFQISGGPAWKAGGVLGGPDRFHIEAKVEGGEAPTIEQMRLLLRSLLADRFKLSIVIDRKPFPAWDLVIDKGGTKLKPSAPDAVRSLSLDARRSPRMSLTATAVTLESLMAQQWLQRYSGRPVVVDKTGLTGKYDFQLQWMSDIGNADTELPDFITALRDQLGLRLQSSTAPLDALTIEHAERPTEN